VKVSFVKIGPVTVLHYLGGRWTAAAKLASYAVRRHSVQEISTSAVEHLCVS